ncbi:hypothetical protein M9H77_25477 [Catharanthus roseus]|uniref:Uncharacterized protein n=1 Tax=Catharanthus roseus TaxID=4058 RepID=A0ACC0A927_CATRO|nr:hypothetical protein M9H77_25477 [Catharanthus roseus]
MQMDTNCIAENRRSADFHPTVWGDFFLSFSSYDISLESDSSSVAKLQYLKEEVKNMLQKTPNNSVEKLDLIDAIQRLGVAYHFDSEIEATLCNIYDSYHELLSKDHQDTNDLRVVALRFRLLRQQGYHVSSDVLSKYKDEESKFSDSSIGTNNLGGILSLYEAANYGVAEENILDEALKFTSSYLESLLPTLNHLDASKVNHALNLPVQKALARVAARLYIPIYEEDESHDSILLKFTKLDFNFLQKLHQKELSDITKWWKGLNCTKNFPFARDRLVECYFWISGVYFEPKYGLARKFVTKVISMTTIIDDIYDAHGTLEELTLFTNAIDRWEINEAAELPSYMKCCYEALLDVYLEMEKELGKQDESRLFGITYAKETMKQLVKAYLEEAKWYYSGYVPSVEEYLKVALITGAYTMLTTNSFVGMGEIATKEAFEWATNQPLLVRAASIICRLTDDIVGHEFEQERGHVASAVECYVKQNGTSKQEAYAEFQKIITNAWKNINKECLEPTAIPKPLLERVVNLARVIHLLYKDEDNFTNSKTKIKNLIILLLVYPTKI